jgi:hypothetical protein
MAMLQNLFFLNNSTFRANYNDPLLLEAKLGNTDYPENSNVYNFGNAKSIRFIIYNYAAAGHHPMHMVSSLIQEHLTLLLAHKFLARPQHVRPRPRHRDLGWHRHKPLQPQQKGCHDAAERQRRQS